MKNIISICIAFLIMQNLMSQTWQWSRQIGGIATDANCQLCSDKYGNVYSAGTYSSDTCHFDNDSLFLLPGAARGFFLAKYNSSGSMQWLRGYKGTSLDSLNAGIADIAYDSINDFIYVCGNFAGSGSIGGISLSANNYNVLIAKYDLSGSCVWAKKASASCACTAIDLAVDVNGNVIITGENPCVATFDTIAVQAGYFLAKYDANGNCLWAQKKFNPNISSYGFDAILWKLEASGTDIFGFGGCTVDSFMVDTTSVQSNFAFGQYLLIRFDSSGITKWAKACAGGFGGAGCGLAVDDSSNSYITGSFSSTAIFENDTLFVSASTLQDLFLAKYNSSGYPIWERQVYSIDAASGQDIFISGENSVYVTGGFRDTATFGNITLISAHNMYSDMFVAKYDTGGSFIGVRHVGYSGGQSVCVDGGNSIYVSGGFSGSTTFDSNPTLTSYGQYDIFIAKSDDIVGKQEARMNGSNRLFIYANPNAGTCNVTIPNEFRHEKNLTLQIFDNSGKQLQKIPVYMDSEKVRLNLEQEARGIYNIILSNGKKNYSGRIVFE